MRKAIATILCLVLLAVTAAGCAETTENIFDTLSGLAWSYCSGAGAWSSDMQIGADGSFICEYHDSDMGDTGDNYPNGTVWFACFSGRMSLAEQVDENTWKIRVDELKQEFAEETIEYGIRYAPAEACGLGEGDIMTLYAPGTAADALSEDMRFWAHLMDQENPDVLENWFLGSEKNESGFVGYPQVLIANPWEDMTAEQLEEASGLRFGVPEGAENVVYRYLAGEGLAEMDFSRANGEYCARVQPKKDPSGMMQDISGLFLDWDYDDDTTVKNLPANIVQVKSDGTWIERLLWADEANGLQYSLTVYADDIDGLDLTAVAEQCMP